MPHNSHSSHTNSSPGDDLGSTDEVKVFKDEGDRDDEKNSSENLFEEKSSLIDLTESEEKTGKISTRTDPVFGKIEPHTAGFNMGYFYSYTNGGSVANKMGLSPFFCHNGEALTTPPPAHCGIPPYQLDTKSIGLTRPTIYPFPTSQYTYSMLSPEMPQVASWHTPSVYNPTAPGFRNPYPSSLPINTSLTSDFSFRFSQSLLPSVHTPPHHMINTHSTMTQSGKDLGGSLNTNGVTDSVNTRFIRTDHQHHQAHLHHHQKNNNQLQSNDCKNDVDKKKPHIKKPLNAFMLYMKEMRAKVVAECTLKESAAINQILGRRWHGLTREEQSLYYDKARQERQLHMELYPGWSARDNYGYITKKKKRKKDRSPADSGGNNMKKCRARFGLDQQNQWCKPCRRKKKCIRYMETDCDESNLTNSNHSLLNIKSNNPSDGEDDLSGDEEEDDIDLDQETESLSTNSPATATSHHNERLPVGANPRDKNNPLSVNQLTGDFLPKQLYQNYTNVVVAAAASSTSSSFYHHNQPVTATSSTQFYETSPKERKSDGGAISVT
ncbi:TCF7L2 family protein [Megaselia abdita]